MKFDFNVSHLIIALLVIGTIAFFTNKYIGLVASGNAKLEAEKAIYEDKIKVLDSQVLDWQTKAIESKKQIDKLDKKLNELQTKINAIPSNLDYSNSVGYFWK